MIQHIVVFNLQDDSKWERIRADVEENFARLPMVRNFRIGKTVRGDCPYKYMFSMDFESQEDLDNYIVMHRPASHSWFIPELGEWVKGLDYELTEF